MDDGRGRKESDTGFERTITYKGSRGHEKYDSSRKRGEMQVVVADRFVVEVRGRKVEWKAIRSAMEALDLDDLTKWKDHGVTK